MIGVLGGGPAGRTAAMKLGLAGKEVTLVEKGGLADSASTTAAW